MCRFIGTTYTSTNLSFRAQRGICCCSELRKCSFLPPINRRSVSQYFAILKIDDLFLLDCRLLPGTYMALAIDRRGFRHVEDSRHLSCGMGSTSSLSSSPRKHHRSRPQ